MATTGCSGDLIDLIAAFNGRGLAHLLCRWPPVEARPGSSAMLFLERVPLRLETIGFLCQCDRLTPIAGLYWSKSSIPATVSLESVTGPAHAIRQHPGMVFLVLIPLIRAPNASPPNVLLERISLVVRTPSRRRFPRQRFDLVVHVHPAAGHGIQRHCAPLALSPRNRRSREQSAADSIFTSRGPDRRSTHVCEPAIRPAPTIGKKPLMVSFSPLHRRADSPNCTEPAPGRTARGLSVLVDRRQNGFPFWNLNSELALITDPHRPCLTGRDQQ